MLYLLRPALPSDLDAILELSRHLDSANLPFDQNVLAGRLTASWTAFHRGPSLEATSRFIFVAEHQGARTIDGCAMVTTPLGTLEAPYVYFSQEEVDAYSPALKRRLVYPTLTLRASRQGPAELGGLVVRPEARGRGLAQALAALRLTWMAHHVDKMPAEVVAELAPQLEPHGSNALWDAIGAPITGLSYREADRLSKRDKSFIVDLFPRTPMPGFLLNDAAIACLGARGKSTEGAYRVLTGQGLRLVPRVDPFDGGPHCLAALRDTLAYQARRREPGPSVLPGRVVVALAAGSGPASISDVPSETGRAPDEAATDTSAAVWGLHQGLRSPIDRGSVEKAIEAARGLFPLISYSYVSSPLRPSTA